MASLFLFITIMVMVGANAIQIDENNFFDPFQGFPFGTQFPFPKIFPTIHIPNFKPIFPKILTPEDIINRTPKPGEMINSVMVNSATGYALDKNGKVIKTGGTTIYTNTNGETKVIKVGDNAPDIKEYKLTPVHAAKGYRASRKYD